MRLRVNREWPCDDCAAEQNSELSPPHSITSSARARTDCGIVSPSALAVLRLMTTSIFVGLFDREILWSGAFKDPPGIGAKVVEYTGQIGAIAHQPPQSRELRPSEHRGQRIAILQCNKLVPPILEQGIGDDDHCTGSLLRNAGERFIDFLFGGNAHDREVNLQDAGTCLQTGQYTLHSRGWSGSR